MDFSISDSLRKLRTHIQQGLNRPTKGNQGTQSNPLLNRKLIGFALLAIVSWIGTFFVLDLYRNSLQKDFTDLQSFSGDSIRELLRRKNLFLASHSLSLQVQKKLNEELNYDSNGQIYWISESTPLIIAIRSYQNSETQWLIYCSSRSLEKATGVEFKPFLKGLNGYRALENIPIQLQLKSSTRRDWAEIVY